MKPAPAWILKRRYSGALIVAVFIALIVLYGCGGGDPEPPTEQLTMCAQPLDQPAAPCDWKRE